MGMLFIESLMMSSQAGLGAVMSNIVKNPIETSLY